MEKPGVTCRALLAWISAYHQSLQPAAYTYCIAGPVLGEIVADSWLSKLRPLTMDS